LVWVIIDAPILPAAILKKMNSARMLVEIHDPKAAFAGERIVQAAHAAASANTGNPMKMTVKDMSISY